ncbi:monocarboxylate transporter 9-like [Polistes fuscatus]|uniref:monocarboxylate transporter 9-like n=1 Tax=Polistes fuscatus TaxID=30207 RepID=UPI001CA8299A|nr:monocarboxylate transporter 9-like [Polistes fuscatus]
MATTKITKNVSGKTKMIPPDGGWGWVVLTSALIVNFLIPGTVKSFGVLFVEFLHVFKASPTAASWMPALCYFLYNSLGPLSSILSSKYSYKTVTLIGGTFAATGMMLSYFANSVSYLYVSYGLMVGIGAGLSFPPTIYIVTAYFQRLRGFANGLCISGSAIGTIVLPPLLQYLLDCFGYRGAVLIMGALTLNTLVCALLYHPVEQHMIAVPIEEGIDNEALSLDEPIETAKLDYIVQDEKSEKLDNTTKQVQNLTELLNYSTSTMSSKEEGSEKLTKSDEEEEKQDQWIVKDQIMDIGNEEDDKVQKNVQQKSEEKEKEEEEEYVKETTSRNDGKVVDKKQLIANEPFNSRQINTMSDNGSNVLGLSIKMHFQEDNESVKVDKPVQVEMSTFKSSKLEISSVKEKSKEKVYLSFDFSMLRDPIYLVILISNSTSAISNTNFMIHLPSYANSQGFDQNSSALLLSVVSALDLIGRISGASLSDIDFVPKYYYFVGGLGTSGIALALLPMADSYGMLSFFCALFGLSSGMYIGITTVILADMLGTEKLSSSYGISLFVNGVLQLIGPPICGVVYEHVGSYKPIFLAFGIILILGTALWALVPLIKRNSKKKLEKV